MTLQTLRTILQTIAGTDIKQVLFDRESYLNESRSKLYPMVLWAFDSMEFVKDIRSYPKQPHKKLKMRVFAVDNYEAGEDMIPIWDALEGYFDVYLRTIDATSVQIDSINEIKGGYYGEGNRSADKEIGMVYEVTLNLNC